MQARSVRPINREISTERPVGLPLEASRIDLVCVDPGNIPYSAVTQPRLWLRKKGGTFSSKKAVQITFVLPMPIKTEPSAFRV